MAEQENKKACEEEEVYVENVRVFKCNNNNESVEDEEKEYDGILLFKIRDMEGRPGSKPDQFEYAGVAFMLEVLTYMDEEDSSEWFEVMENLVDELGLFGSCSGRVAREMCTFLKGCFRFGNWTYDSIVVVVDVSMNFFDCDDDGRSTDELTRIADMGKRCWGVEMEMEEVKAGAKITRAKKRAREEEDKDEDEEQCSICFEELAGKVDLQLPENHPRAIVRLKCGHGFHKCIFNWLPKKPSCPNCRCPCLAIV